MTQDEKKFQEWHEFDVGKKNALGVYNDPMVAIAWDAWKARTEQLDALADALEVLFESYKQLADSGDAGNWKLEDSEEGQKAIAALATYRGKP